MLVVILFLFARTRLLQERRTRTVAGTSSMMTAINIMLQDCNKHHARVFVIVVVIILGIRGIGFSRLAPDK